MSDSSLARAIGLALTGNPDLLEVPSADPLEDLAERGWGRARLVAHAEQARAAGEAWPHPVPAEVRASAGSARLLAVLQRLQHELGVFGHAAPPAAPRPPTADERRLLHEVPPHHGH